MTNSTTTGRHIFKRFSLRVVQESSAVYLAPTKFQSARDVATVIAEVCPLHDKTEEHLVLLCLNAKNVVTGVIELSIGTLSASLIHPREIFKHALMMNAHAIILVHNHPSGDVGPSNADRQVTSLVKEASTLLQIDLLDHVIVGGGDKHGEVFSFRENSLL